MKRYPLITAHSGCDGTPDNSLEFVAYALGLEIDAFEIDVRKKGNLLYIRHDKPESELEELVSLESVFFLAKEKEHISINCDLKEENLELDVLELAKRCGLKNQIIFSGWVCLDTIRGIQASKASELYLDAECILEKFSEVYLNVECMLEHFYEDRIKEANPNEPGFTEDEIGKIINQMIDCGAKTLNIHFSFARKDLIDALEAHEIKLSIWTPSTEETLQLQMNRNFRNITTRTPKLAISMRNQLNSK